MLKTFACAVLASAAVTGAAAAGPIFAQPSYSADVTFTDALGSTTMTIAFDGANYWSSSGGGSGGVRYAKYDASGALVDTYSPGIDFRSVFTNADGDVLARGYNSPTIYEQTSDGVFAPLLTLTGGTLDDQSSVVLNEDGRFVAMESGLVNIWDGTGAFLNSFSLSGYSDAYPENRGVAAAGDHLLTYDNAGTLSAWDYSGALVDTATLLGAGTTFNSGFSLSFANGRIFIVDDAGGTWRGYDIGFAEDGGPAEVPLPATLPLLASALGLIAVARGRRTRA